MHVHPGMTVDRVPQDRQRPDEPRHRMGTLHTPLAPDPGIVKAEVLLAIEEGQLNEPSILRSKVEMGIDPPHCESIPDR
jgi:hypothetical protein